RIVEEAYCIAGHVFRREHDLFVHGSELLLQHRLEEALLALEVDVDEVLVALRALRDAVNSGASNAVRGELLGRCLQDPGSGGFSIPHTVVLARPSQSASCPTVAPD